MAQRRSLNSRTAARIRCAIYTRKSSEEGLDQAFNSLDAQREACDAYIRSQKSEGWVALKDRYDDGGFSGGNMERPGLARLLEAIKERRVDTVVVYKVDRLTRSLRDFAKIVDVFDAHDVSFVSVTQQFNTTTSMGRLTLNMLLSFAQFEREVTGERIRDKIAASKRKGMWMGGNVPLGYDTIDRKLVINAAEATLVREVYRRYLKLRSVYDLKASLDRDGYRSKVRTNRHGKVLGGKPFQSGALYKMLQNCIYRGEIAHVDQIYPGEHEAIIDESLWEAVQTCLAQNRAVRASDSNAAAPSLLKGLIFDETGARLTPTHSQRKGRRYRYYVSQPLTKGSAEIGWRVPARDLERIVVERIRELLRDEAQLFELLESYVTDLATRTACIYALAQIEKDWQGLSFAARRDLIEQFVSRIDLRPGWIRLAIDIRGIVDCLIARGAIEKVQVDSGTSQVPADPGSMMRLEIPIELKRAGMETRLLLEGTNKDQRRESDTTLHQFLARALQYRALFEDPQFRTMEAMAAEAGVSPPYFSRALRVSFLAPDLVASIVRNRHAVELTVRSLLRRVDLPPFWAAQRELFGKR